MFSLVQLMIHNLRHVMGFYDVAFLQMLQAVAFCKM
jgi:hypothetical protein